MVNTKCRWYSGDETPYCLKKGFDLDCTGCHGFIPQKKLRALIIQKCGTVRRFSEKVGLTEAMMSKVLNGSRVLMPWHYDNFAKVLGITKGELAETIDTDMEGRNENNS